MCKFPHALCAVLFPMVALAAQSGTMNIKDGANEIVITASTSDRTLSVSIRNNRPDTVVKVKIVKADGTVGQFVELVGEGDGTGVLNLKAGERVEVEDIDPSSNTDDVKIAYDAK
ncbi:MAG: hypothetical protein JNK78_15410 [Planctomycetes bacterium]|nr:hypothetical protein [Planctomycetota bacterium]